MKEKKKKKREMERALVGENMGVWGKGEKKRWRKCFAH